MKIEITPAELAELLILIRLQEGGYVEVTEAGLPEMAPEIAEEPEAEPEVVAEKPKRAPRKPKEAEPAKAAEPAKDAEESEELTLPYMRSKVAAAMLKDKAGTVAILTSYGPAFGDIPTDKWPELLERLA